MWMQRRTQVDLNKHLVLHPQGGEASEVKTGLSVGINLPQGEERDGTAGSQLANTSGKSQEVGALWGCWEIPAMPLTSSGLRSSRGYNNEGGGEWKGGARL